MHNVFPVPKHLQHRFTSVSDNRKLGDEVAINPQLFVEVFRDDLEKWLTQHRKKLTDKRSSKCDSIPQNL